MHKSFLFLFPLAIGLFFIGDPKEHEINEPQSQWKIDIGKTSYRTNVSFTNDFLIIGSNGDNYRDYNVTDRRNGVHVINRKTGKPISNFCHESFGDLDVNGTLIYNNQLFFGNDNDEFICSDFRGNIKYSLPVSGDIESQAVLHDINGKKAIVFGTEAGELRAIDPKDGTTLWQHFHEDFNGWKMGDNRLVFKIKTHFSSDYLFNEKPELADLNNDGIKDIIFIIYREFYAVDGKTGQLLNRFKIGEQKENTDWSDPSNLHTTADSKSVMYLKNKNGDIQIVIPTYSYKPIPNSNRTDYALYLTYFNTKGTKLKTQVLSEKTMDYDLVRLPNTNIYASGSAIFQLDNNQQIISKQTIENISDDFDYQYYHFVSDQLVQYDNKTCVVVLYEYENIIGLFDINSGKAIKTFPLEKRSEFIPVFVDVNKDGKIDLLTADDSNNLTCIELDTHVKILNP